MKHNNPISVRRSLLIPVSLAKAYLWVTILIMGQDSVTMKLFCNARKIPNFCCAMKKKNKINKTLLGEKGRRVCFNSDSDNFAEYYGKKVFKLSVEHFFQERYKQCICLKRNKCNEPSHVSTTISLYFLIKKFTISFQE